MGRVILLCLLLITSVYAEENTWIDDWWTNDYSEIQAKQIQQTKKQSSCALKLKKYKDKVDRYPNNKYYIWRYNSWKKQCTDEKLKKLTIE